MWIKTNIILSYFHTRIGTDIFYTFPETQVDNAISDRLYDVMTQQKDEEFFTHAVGDLKLLNYYFQIRSDWARGHREMLMLSIMFNRQISQEIEEHISLLCKKFGERMRANKDIFTGFHLKELNNYNEDDKERIRTSEGLIKEWVKDLYWEILEETRKKSEEEKITVLLNDRYIFESLEKMSGELKNISREINSSEDSLKTNLNISNSISSLNKIIDDLYGGYIEKMTELDIENENGLFSTEEDEDPDIKKSKKEKLLQLLEDEISGKKE